MNPSLIFLCFQLHHLNPAHDGDQQCIGSIRLISQTLLIHIRIRSHKLTNIPQHILPNIHRKNPPQNLPAKFHLISKPDAPHILLQPFLKIPEASVMAIFSVLGVQAVVEHCDVGY